MTLIEARLLRDFRRMSPRHAEHLVQFAAYQAKKAERGPKDDPRIAEIHAILQSARPKGAK